MALLGLLGVSVVMGSIARNLNMEYDLSVLKSEGKAYDELSEEDRALAELTYSGTIFSYPDAESLRAGQADLLALQEAGEVPHLGRVVSVFDVVPTEQAQRFVLLREIRDFASDPNYIYLPGPLRKNLEVLQEAKLQPIQISELPLGLAHLIGADRDNHRLMVFPKGNVWDLREVSVLKTEAEDFAAQQGVSVAGEYLVVGSLGRVLRHDAPVVAVGAILLVWLGTMAQAIPALLKPKQRATAIRRSIGAMVVLALGMTWAAGALVLAKVDLTILNLVGIPILLGIGVDVVIHLLHRLAEEGPGRVLKALSTTGWASGLSAATTILSFTSLAFAQNRGVQSLGMLVLVGLTAVTLAGFLLVTTGWMTTWKLGGFSPDSEER